MQLIDEERFYRKIERTGLNLRTSDRHAYHDMAGERSSRPGAYVEPGAADAKKPQVLLRAGLLRVSEISKAGQSQPFLSASSMVVNPYHTGEKMDASYSELSRWTGKSYRTIRAKLDAAGLSPVKQGTAILWDSAAALDAIYCPSECDGGILDLNAERAREAKERADKLELANAERRGELCWVADVEKSWAEIVMRVKTKFTGIPSKLAALATEPDEGRRIFTEARDIVNQALTEIARGRD
jgi:hypothetical protein